MKVSNYMVPKDITRDIIKEIKYFDGVYLSTRKENANCAIDFYYSGHGTISLLQLSKDELLAYGTLVDSIVSNINKHTINLFKENDLSEHKFKYKDPGYGDGYCEG